MSLPLGGEMIVLAMALLALVVPTVLLYRVLERAGFSPWISLLALIPTVGVLAVLALLAFSCWPSLDARSSPFADPS